MKKLTLIFVLIAAVMTISACNAPGNNPSAKESAVSDPSKPVIVMVAFGTSEPNARKVFDYIDAQAKKRFAGYEIRWAFTSQFIIDKLKRQGVVTYSPAEVVADLKSRGVKSAVFQSLHIVPGQEFGEIEKLDKSGMKTAIGGAMMASENDINRVVAAIGSDVVADAANVIVGHGNDKFPQFNAKLLEFDAALTKQYPNAMMCTVEGSPGMKHMEQAKLLAAKTGKVNFIPLMIVAGDHIMNDVMGDEPESWKKIIAAPQATCVKPLGYNDAALAIIFDHLDEAIRNVK